MKGAVLEALDAPISQTEFAQAVGVSDARISVLVKEGLLIRGDTGAEWLLAYCEQLRIAAARRPPSTGDLDPVHEKAGLDREGR